MTGRCGFWEHTTEVARHGDEYEVSCLDCPWSKWVRGHRAAYGTQRNHGARLRDRDGRTARQAR